MRNVKILTPEIINEINTDTKTTSIDNDGQSVKKRKLIGPKSKTKFQIYRSPPSLLQCALQKINELICPSAPLKDLTTINETYDTHKTSFTKAKVNSIKEEVLTFNNYSLNVYAPVECNYCFKLYGNLIDLATHEVDHIQAYIGPRLEDKKYGMKYRHYNKLYRESIERIEREIFLEENGLLNLGDDMSDNTSLLVPEIPEDTDHVYEVINNEITVNGKPLKDYDKTERRNFYKSINIDGVKRKFCPICRHTFKDNWAIDIHYLNSSCQYTCKYCGLKFKFHKDLYPEHLKSHEGEPCNKIFGPADRKTKFKRRKVLKMNRFGGFTGIPGVIPPKVKPIKMKNLLMKKSPSNPVKIKEEPDTNSAPGSSNEAEPTGNIQPYQAYFCRKCFKVFFKIDEFNTHTAICKGGDETLDESLTPTKRPQRSCVRDFPVVQDSDSESSPRSWSPNPKTTPVNSGGTGYECGICCSSFPSRHSRNSHMRIHKMQKGPGEQVTNFFPQATSTPPIKYDPPKPPQDDQKIGNIRLANLNPTVARLVQNNPHLTIRSYTKSPSSNSPAPEVQSTMQLDPKVPFEQAIKRAYRCADCNGKFENKSLLYYHKLNTCVVKRHFECGFCKKKFTSQEHYNTHMLYVHPE